MSATLGRACLLVAFATCFYGMGASLYGARAGGGLAGRGWVDSGRRAVYALAATVALAFLVLELAFLRSDFSFNTVAQHSSLTTPTFYKITAVWSSQEGSLLLWVLLLSCWSALVLRLTRRRLRLESPYATVVLLGFGAFFLGLMIFAGANPFSTTRPAPADGTGLDPLLLHPSMMIHPPMLYSGYTLFTIPFAFAIGALVTGRLNAEWLRATRRFSLAAWLCLGTGIILGARWSYTELGWGGYWAWDPVENASLMPWLCGTAFLHSAMIQEKRGMLKVWNVSLVLATGTLAILGTFLVRSGILQSIHAFGASTLGGPFLSLIGLMVAGSIGLVVWRRGGLRTEHRLDSLLSREAMFLLNNFVLVGLCFVVFWGSFFPLISEAITGTKRAVGPPWFDRFVVPLTLLLVLLSGIGPLIAWRRATPSNLGRNLGPPALVGALTALALGVGVSGVARKPLALALFALAAFVLAAVAQELMRGTRARQAMTGEPLARALVSLVRRNRRRYGGYLVHVGVALLFVGIAASSTFQHIRDVQLVPGQSTRVDGYDVRYVRPVVNVALSGPRIAHVDFGAQLAVSKGAHAVTSLYTQRSYYPDTSNPLAVAGYFDGQADSKVGLSAGLRRDIWTVIQPIDLSTIQTEVKADDQLLNSRPGLAPDVRYLAVARGIGLIRQRYLANPPPTTFRVIVSPMVTWIWLGALVVLIGGLTAFWPGGPSARRQRAPALATQLEHELGRALERA
ncbi:MAG: heme lyase CcmF/NrfE family subunit [Solirubrobacteraceae bacterium]|nr:MAG: cytochrome C biogenesis protein [Solirubrobacterales bacterium]